jgi:hypothetical protein
MEDQDADTILHYVAQQFATLLRQATAGEEPLVLWHYTRPEAFLKIVENGTLRSSHIQFMNDEREYRLATDLALKAVKAAVAAATSQPERDVLAEMEKWIGQGMDLETSNHVFVGSLSAARDDLSQWRAYGGPEGGISIGFRYKDLQGISARSDVHLVPVEYDAQRQTAICANLIGGAVHLYRTMLAAGRPITYQDFALSFVNRSTTLAALFKDSTFAAEKEWRLVKVADASQLPAINFLGKETVVTPTIDYDLKLEGQKLLPISEIVVGPGRMTKHSKVAIQAFLLKYGYAVVGSSPQGTQGTVTVTASSVPYRVVK